MIQGHILIVDDETNMRNLLRLCLTQEGYEVTEAKDGFEALDLLKKIPFDLIILDIVMPDLDGWEVCRNIRDTKKIPILMLTARSDTKDKVQGLKMGADDYLVKPFEMDELAARVVALLRRVNLFNHSNERSAIHSYQNMSIHHDSREVWVCHEMVELTPKEYDLLYFLITRPRRVFSRETLLDQIWGSDYFGDIRTVDTHVKNIRDKLRKAGLAHIPIQTVWGIGYKLEGIDERQ
ncbi:two-component system response regulator ResD [Paenibacillus taihuensis]|uniref:Two-component system response regulator ResD n=1 Tax=Paenibacillus taihuensis TaxID=1156355 RepID=A0A3D9S6F9_9BACL|nr:response regulator transcription factor [Paenibacillus taihuensis]REE88564.1 two-component system response regulator ResD [Paenibacillus taihuensis]